METPTPPRRGGSFVRRLLSRTRSKSRTPVAKSASASSTPSLAPRFNRIAASLRIPHYYGSQNITSPSSCTTSNTSRSSGIDSEESEGEEEKELPFALSYKKNNTQSLPRGVGKQRYAETEEEEEDDRPAENSIFLQQLQRYSEEAGQLCDRLNNEEDIDESHNKSPDTPDEDDPENNGLETQPSLEQTFEENMNRLRKTSAALRRGCSVERKSSAQSMNSMTPHPQLVGSDSNDSGTAVGAMPRKCIRETRVQLHQGSHYQERFLFLFHDLLLVVKEKTSNSYKLKEKVRLTDIWIRRGGCEEVAEHVTGVNAKRSFVIGWPTCNWVATFPNETERNGWFDVLSKMTEEQKACEQPNIANMTVFYKTPKLCNQTRCIAVTNRQTAREIVSIALSANQLSSEAHQLWVHSTRNAQPVLLLGHENVFAILMSHVREMYPFDAAHLTVQQLSNLANMQAINARCRFVLRPRSQSAAGPSNRKTRLRRNIESSKLLGNIKRKVLSRSDSCEASLSTLASTSSGKGILFGRPLHSLTDDNSVPKPILSILSHLVIEGTSTEGIFRKPPKQSTVKALKERLDVGEEVVFDGSLSALVTASLLKDFLRNIPGKLLVNDLYYEWMSVNEEPDALRKVQSTKRLISQLPPANYQMLRHVLCVLGHIVEGQTLNQMTPSNLSVCIGQSLLEKPNSSDIQDSVKRIPLLTQYLIENIGDLFGSDTLQLLDAVDKPKTRLAAAPKVDDHVVPIYQREGSGSLTNSSTSPEPASLARQIAVNDSRDSGLSDVDGSTSICQSTIMSATQSLQRPHALMGGKSMTASWHPDMQGDSNSSSPSTPSTPSVTLQRSDSGEHLLLKKEKEEKKNRRPFDMPTLTYVKSRTFTTEQSARPMVITCNGTASSISPPSRDDNSTSGHGSVSSVASSSTLSPKLSRRTPISTQNGERVRHRFTHAMRSKSNDCNQEMINNVMLQLTSDEEEEEEVTPMVSRETSRAHELHEKVMHYQKRIAHERTALTLAPPVEKPPPTPVVCAPKRNMRTATWHDEVVPAPLAEPYSARRGQYSWEADAKPPRPIAQVAGQIRNHLSSPPTHRKLSSGPSRRPPTYEAALIARRTSLRQDEQEVAQIVEATKTHSVQSRPSMERRVVKTTLTVNDMPSVRLLQRRRAPRRKTLGGDEFNAIAAQYKATVVPPPSHASIKPAHSARPSEINWSVHHLRSMFDPSNNSSHCTYPVVVPPPLHQQTLRVPTLNTVRTLAHNFERCNNKQRVRRTGESYV